MGDITPKADAGVTDEEKQRGAEESDQINELCQHNSWVMVFEWEWRTELGETGHTAKGPQFTDNDGQGWSEPWRQSQSHGVRGTPEFRGELQVKVESPLSAALPLRLQGKAVQGTRWFRNKNLAKVDARSAWLEAYYPDGRPQRGTQKTAEDPFRDLVFTCLPYDTAQFTQFSHMDGTLHKKETELKDFLNAAFLQAGLSAVPSEQPCNAIISVRINVPKGTKGAKPRMARGMPCAFARFRTPQEATRGLHLNEIVFKKHSMQAARVRGYEAAANEDATAPDTWPEFMEKRVAQQPELEGRVVGLAKPGEDITRGVAHGPRTQELSQLEADLGLRAGICLEWGVCVDWLRGECSFGDQCKFLHAMPEGASSPAQPKVLPKEEVAEPEPEPQPEPEPELELEPESSPEQQPEPEIVRRSGSPRTPPVTETVVPEEDVVQAAMEKLRSSPAGKFYTESQLRNAALRQVARQQPEPGTPPAPKTPPSREPPQPPEQAAAAGQEVAAKPELDAEVTALLTKTHLERYAELLREHGLSSMAALMAIKSKQDLVAVGLKIGPAAALHRKLSGTRHLRSRFPPSSLLT